MSWRQCRLAGCGQVARWRVVRTIRHDEISGPVHDGRYVAPELAPMSRLAEYCEDHAAAVAVRRNQTIRDKGDNR